MGEERTAWEDIASWQEVAKAFRKVEAVRNSGIYNMDLSGNEVVAMAHLPPLREIKNKRRK